MASSRSLGTLTLDLILKLGGFKSGADQAARESDKLKKKLSADAESIKGAFTKIGATLGIGLGVQQVVSELISAGKEAVAFGDEISRAAIKTGQSAESMTELAYAAKITDVEFGALVTGVGKMQKAVAEATLGNKAAVESFALIGLTLDDLKGKNADQQFELVADAISKIPDEAEQARAVMDIFGKSGADLLPLFQKGAAGIRELREEAHALGVTLTDEQAQALSDVDDAVVRLTSSYEGLTRQMTAAAAPTISGFFDAVTASIKALNDENFTWLDQLKRIGQAYALANEQDKGIFDPVTALDLANAYKQVADEAERAARAATPGGTTRGGLVRDERMRQTRDEAAAAKANAEARKQAEADAKRAASEAERAAAERAREQERALDQLAKQYEDTYKRGAEAIAATRTESERERDVLDEQIAALDQLAETFPNMAEAAAQAKQRLEDEFLSDVVVTVSKIEVPPTAAEQFKKDFKENVGAFMEDSIASFLEDPFHTSFENILADFEHMLVQMAARALAAQITDKILGSATGGGFLEKLATAFAGGFESGGFIPPGRVGLVGEAGPELVMGGNVGKTIVPMASTSSPTRAPVTQNLFITTQGGNISRQTELQITAAAARGVKTADRRNN